MKKLLLILILFCSIAVSGQQPHMNLMMVQPAGGTTLKNGLISCWEFNETSGTTAFDAFGSNDGTNNGATINQTGILNQSYSYDGISNKIIFGNILNFDYNEPFSFSLWVNRGSDNSIDILFCNQNSASPYRGYLIFLNATTGKVNFGLSNTAATNALEITSTAGILAADGWTHLVCTYDGSVSAAGLKIYINGTLSSSTVGYDNLSLTTISTTSLYLGTRVDTYYFDGFIDQAIVWNRAITPTEISILNNSMNGLAFINW